LSAASADVEQMVRGRFAVRQFYALPDGELEFQVAYEAGTKEKFTALSAELETKGYRPELTGTKDESVLVIRKATPYDGKPSRFTVFLALFALASIVVFGLAEALNYEQFAPSLQPDFVLVSFSASAAMIVSAHEIGQRMMSQRRKAGHANSYLIPWLPFLPPAPTLGFATTQREPAMNRDALFDTVIAGPLVLLAFAMVIYAIGDMTSVPSTVLYQWAHNGNASSLTNENVIQSGLDVLLGPALPKAVTNSLPISPLADASTVGFILVFIGLLPMAFFDGGYLAALAWRPLLARAGSYVSVLALLVLDTPNYWGLAIIVLLLAGRTYHLKLLDEVSELSKSRKLIYAGAIVLAFLCLPIPHNLGTLPLP
jgi:membrane-associated protease RseP (regulator of RpoE activity)